MSEGRRLNKTGIRCALAALALFGGLLEMRSTGALEWEPVEGAQQNISEPEPIKQDTQHGTALTWTSVDSSDATTQEQQGLNWTAVSETDQTESDSINSAVVWEPIQPGEVITAEELEVEEDPDEVLVTTEPSGPTFANDKAIWRDDTWHPQISSLVPVGFGPKGTMVSFGMYGWDCIPTTAGPCRQPSDLNDYLEEVEQRGEAEWEGSIGIGDTRQLLGLTVTGMFEETNLPLGGRNDYETENPRGILDNYYVGMHLSRSIGDDTSVRVGIKNWIDVRDEDQSGMRPKSSYGVISQRFRLREKQSNWFPNLYLTAGLGNGEFRPVDKKFKAVIAGQRAQGCITYGAPKGKACSTETLNKIGGRYFSYGELVPIGALALEVYPGFNLIGEWNEGNLKAGFSVRPFKNAGLIFTSMWGSLLKNCDWGCNVSIPGLKGGAPIDEDLTTDRIKWSFNLTYNLSF
ncbi:hypothetical protein KR49_06490 [Synechococcus sp. KORDI-49]|uniref:hypothetical protein n=1 Tax=Synechococcus sp. KORDI-49 TaxID=585423 RepID=UPI0004E09856|nr:hypothetical protein [Synechococcus sp. KORDI-49]AII46099.1 hypothetical protein KR49_06490 [Synechococcus sp. KORDI-49]